MGTTRHIDLTEEEWGNILGALEVQIDAMADEIREAGTEYLRKECFEYQERLVAICEKIEKEI